MMGLSDFWYPALQASKTATYLVWLCHIILEFD